MKKPIEVIIINPEKLSINFTNAIIEIFEKRIADHRELLGVKK
ncbi:MAG: hypothetical protein ACI8WT_001720 [Clostridium sp.]|jgi:hypothetical protein